MTFIEKVDLLRRLRGLSERTLAAELGIDASAISRWRSRKSIPRPEIVKRMADLFGLTADVLVDRTKPLPTKAVSSYLATAAARATAMFPDNPAAGQLAFEQGVNDHLAIREKAAMADFLREKAKALRKEAAALEKQAAALYSR